MCAAAAGDVERRGWVGWPGWTDLDHVGEPAFGDGRDGRQLDAALQEADVVLLLQGRLPAGRQRVPLQTVVHARLVQHRAQLTAQTYLCQTHAELEPHDGKLRG